MTAKKGTSPGAPVRTALRAESSLVPLVADGIQAMREADRRYLAPDVRDAFADSLDIDTAFHKESPEQNRWDYLLGHAASGTVIALEPHSAKEDQVSRIIAKRDAARRQLAKHLRPGAHIADWLWVASANVQFADTEKTRRRLDQHGIRFVGRKVLARDLPKRR